MFKFDKRHPTIDKLNKQTRDRGREFRKNMSQEGLEERKYKARERYKKKKEQGSIKSIKDYSDREKRDKRLYWRQASKKYREKKKKRSTT